MFGYNLSEIMPNLEKEKKRFTISLIALEARTIKEDWTMLF